MNNISNVKDCYGCGVCAISCGKKIIDIKLDCNGFYKPYITNESKCIHCGICRDVCSYCHSELAADNEPLISFAGWSNNKEIRAASASGGVGFEISRYLLQQGYKVVATKYNHSKNRAENYISENTADLYDSQNSKYIQSYTLNGFLQINIKNKYLITGTPCQIDSFRRFIKRYKCEDNFILLDFFCHGVPSKLIWDKYIGEVTKQVGNITDVHWRNKDFGWHDSWNMFIKGERSNFNSRWTKGDPFYALFLGNNCLGKACYKNCKFKYNHSSADIRIGDLWGKAYKNEEKGVSSCVAFTSKGKNIVEQCDIERIEHTFEIVAEDQIKQPIKYPTLTRHILLKLARYQFIHLNTLCFISRVSNGLSRRFIK